MNAESWILTLTVVAVALTYLGFITLRRNEHSQRTQTYRTMNLELFSKRVRPIIRRGFFLTMVGGIVTASSLGLLVVVLVIGLLSAEDPLVVGLLTLVAGTIVAVSGEYTQHRAWIYAKKLQH